MTTLQEQFEKDFPDKFIEKIEFSCRYEDSNFTNWDLDLREYVNLTRLICFYNNLTSLNVSGLSNLIELNCSNNNLGGDLTPFSKFVNLTRLLLGNAGGGEDGYYRGTGNYFHGSLEPLKNLTKLIYLCIEGTNIDEGLEYLPPSLAQATKGKPKPMNFALDCTAGKRKVKAIQDQLRPFNYDLEA